MNSSDKINYKYKLQNVDNDYVPTTYGFGTRHVQILLVFLTLLVGLMTRAHLGITIVAMTSTDDANVTSSNINHSGVVIDTYNNAFDVQDSNSNDMYRTYKWSKSTQEMVLMSFVLGYAIMMFPAGLVSQRWGGKLPLQISLLVCGLTSIPLPWLCAWGDWKALCACRILQGISQSGVSSSTHNILGKWIPLSERSRFTTLVYTGSSLGIVTAFQLGGIVSASNWGWPAVFWIIGILNLILFVLITLLMSSTPSSHKNITPAEKNFILGKIDCGVSRRRKIPWKPMLSSKPLWAVIGSHVATGISYMFCTLEVPSYLHHVLKVDVKRSGLLASLPYIGNVIVGSVIGALSDFLTNRKILKLRTARIVFNTIGEGGMAITLALVTFTSNTSLAVTCFVLSLASFTAIHAGGMVSYIDLAPDYSATSVAIGNTFMYTLLLGIPILVSQVVTDMSNQLQWRTIFLTTSALAVTGSLSFIIFVSADKQPWNDYDDKEESEESNPMREADHLN